MLRALVLLASLVPLLAGGAGALLGAGLPGNAAALDSHLRYLSGLLLGIGVAFAWAALDLPRRAWVFDLLAPIVILGGAFRLLGLLGAVPPWPHVLALGMELAVTPLLWWGARRAKQDPHG